MTHASSRRASGAASRHPVIELLKARRAAGSKPLARSDGARVALVVEGGAMRGIVSCAMAGALERAGLTSAFDLVVGTSAGALNGAALLAGVAEGCTRAYAEDFTSRRFIDVRRLVIGRPVVDVAWSMDFACDYLDADRHRRTLESPIEPALPGGRLRDLPGGRPDRLQDARRPAPRAARLEPDAIRRRASGRALDGRRYLDGGLVEPIPIAPAREAGATHLLVLQTRPEGVPRSHPGRFVDRMIERRLRALNPGLVEVWRRRTPDYERMVPRSPPAAPMCSGSGRRRARPRSASSSAGPSGSRP